MEIVSFRSKYFIISIVITSLTHELFTNVCFKFVAITFILTIFLFLISNLVVLQKSAVCMYLFGNNIYIYVHTHIYLYALTLY